MTVAAQIKENLPFGQEVLNKLFELNSTELRAKVKEICGEKLANYQHLFEGSVVEKTIRDDKPYRIKISYFDQISIDAIGIGFRREHGSNFEMLIWFTKYFKLD
jgi:hypothetical protein